MISTIKPSKTLLITFHFCSIIPLFSHVVNAETAEGQHDWNLDPLYTGITVAIFTFFFILSYIAFYYCLRYLRRADPTQPDPSSDNDSTENGVDPAFLITCPVFTYSEVSGHLGPDTDPLECAVCLSQFEADDTLRLLPTCDHVFHVECVDRWLAGNDTCPLCRAELELTPGESARVGSGRVGGRDSSGVGRLNDVAEEGRGIHTQGQCGGKYRRWNSAGHVAVVGGLGYGERFTLRLPDNVRDNFFEDKLYRSRSCIISISR